MGISMSAPTRVRYLTDTDDLSVRGWITGRGYTRLMDYVDAHISKTSYSKTNVYRKDQIDNSYYDKAGANLMADHIAYGFNVTGYHKNYDKLFDVGQPRIFL